MINLESFRKLKFIHINKCYMHKPESVLQNEIRNALGFWNTNGSPNPDQKTRPSYSQQKKKKENLPNRALCRPDGSQSENQRKRKERQVLVLCHWTKKTKNKKNKTEKLWNINVTVIPIVIGVLGTTPKGLVRGLKEFELGGRAETIQTTVLLMSARILRKVLEKTCHSDASKRLLVRIMWKKKNLQGIMKTMTKKIHHSHGDCGFAPGSQHRSEQGGLKDRQQQQVSSFHETDVVQVKCKVQYIVEIAFPQELSERRPTSCQLL